MPSSNRPASSIASLYRSWCLDILPAVGPACYEVYRDHPEKFRKVPRNTVRLMSQIKFRNGMSESFLSLEQRHQLIAPIIGASDCWAHEDMETPFSQAAQALRSSAVAYTQQVHSSSEKELIEAFRDSAHSFQKILSPLRGSVIRDSDQKLRAQIRAVVRVLRDPEFAAGMALQPVPQSGWPFNLTSNNDRDAPALVNQLWLKAAPALNQPSGNFDKNALSVIQRISYYGSSAIDGALSDPTGKSKKDTKAAISIAYRWWTALVERNSNEKNSLVV